MKKRMSKLIAYLLTTALTLSVLPLNMVYANKQAYISDLNIQYMSSTAPQYDVTLGWSNPTPSTAPDLAANGPSWQSDIHDIEGYFIYRRNATAKQSKADLLDTIDKTKSNYLVKDNVLTPGSIYAYSVRPYHKHQYATKNSAGAADTKMDYAPYDTSIPESEVLFMSDIQVEAKGSGSTLTVTWDNPTLDGTEIFSGYRIFYQSGGSKVTTFNSQVDVSLTDKSLIRTTDSLRAGVQRLTYSINNPNDIIQGETYAVKVEPIYAGSLIRDIPSGKSYNMIAVPSGTALKTYNITFSTKTVKEYRTNDASISIPLEILENGVNSLNLHWWGISKKVGNIESLVIKMGSAPDQGSGSNWSEISTIYGNDSIFVNYWQVDRPTSGVTYYQISVNITGKTTPLLSEIAMYDPTQINITPNKPDIQSVKAGAGTSTAKTIDVTWNAFTRYPYTASEQAFADPIKKTIVDKDIAYNVWVSDDLNLLSDSTLTKILDMAPPSKLQSVVDAVYGLPGYKANIGTYIASADKTQKNLQTNKIYYIKVQAVKQIKDATGKIQNLISESAYTSIYIDANGNIATPPNISKPPLRVKKDTSGYDVITKDSITIQWNKSWYEIYDPTTNTWNAKVSFDGVNLLFGDAASASNFIDIYKAGTIADVKSKLIAAGVSSGYVNTLIIRQVTLDDAQYEILVAPYSDVEKTAGGYQAYVDKALADATGKSFTAITPQGSAAEPEYQITKLTQNTTYLILLRPYIVNENGKNVTYPSYIMATTLPDGTNVNITPTVPTIQADSNTDTQLTVKWENSINLKYELSISELQLADPSKGTIVPFDTIITETIPLKDENGISKRFYTFKNLLPDTGYYICVRATAENKTGTVSSAWSNPVFVVTNDLTAPNVPDGFGVASNYDLKIINKANGTTYVPIDVSSIILEWLRDVNDVPATGTAPTTPTSTAKPSVTTTTDTEVLTSADIPSSLLAKFNNLIANKKYYARAKTRLTVTADKSGASTKTYTYVIQISPTKDFTDYVEVEAPQASPAQSNGSYFKQKESAFTTIIMITTSYSKDEYDGDVDPDLIPLPEDDFEITYDYYTDTLLYRFRSDAKDAAGNKDNLTDQRFISKLIQNKTYTYGIDVSKYNNTLVNNRTVEIPYTVMQAFKERKINLKIKADNLTLTVLPGTIETADVKGIKDFGKGSSVTIKLNADDKNNPGISTSGTRSQKYLSSPKTVKINVVTPTRNVAVTNAATPLKVSMKLDNRKDLLDKNVDGYVFDGTIPDWQRVPTNYDKENGVVSFDSTKVGIYSVIALEAPNASTSVSDWSYNAYVSVCSKLNMKDLKTYVPNSAVTPQAFNNIISAVANNRKDVTLKDTLAQKDKTALTKAGMYASDENQTVTRQVAISALVSLYEAKTKRAVKNYTPLEESSYYDVAYADPAYVKNLLKADQIGFYTENDMGAARVDEELTYGELMYMLDIVYQDAK